MNKVFIELMDCQSTVQASESTFSTLRKSSVQMVHAPSTSVSAFASPCQTECCLVQRATSEIIAAAPAGCRDPCRRLAMPSADGAAMQKVRSG